ncbi:MAG: deoxyribodipyrimidine photo-lyase [Firmicutes bacterium]|nr:deoxyribodipyrimidine photo-lyase [Bacillota bacterium]
MNFNRVLLLKKGNSDHKGKYVIYWMQQSQRVHYNHALEYAIQIANQNDLPVLVYFGLSANYPEANRRHYQFMLEGLKEVFAILRNFKISYVLKLASPEVGILPYLDQTHCLVMDQGYLRHQRQWRDDVVKYAKTNLEHLSIFCVDTDLIVPVLIASQKAEYGAYTLRPKIRRLVNEFRDFTRLSVLKNQNQVEISSDDDLSDMNHTLKRLNLDHEDMPQIPYQGGYLEASKLCLLFITYKSSRYLESNDPSHDDTSKLSMYLHFGQISALEIYERVTLALERQQMDGAVYDAFVEQLVVRRELAFNYVYYQEGYDQFETMTEPWAYMTMKIHHLDFKPYIYSLEQIEMSKTHDPYFNAAMKEMYLTGFMHSYMRMYWAKKIIEWTMSFKDAYETIKYLNNKYFIDGRDANSYAGIAWCFGKHDRAWTERSIFGKLRYMNDKGLERKFDIRKYSAKIETMGN